MGLVRLGYPPKRNPYSLFGFPHSGSLFPTLLPWDWYPGAWAWARDWISQSGLGCRERETSGMFVLQFC